MTQGPLITRARELRHFLLLDRSEQEVAIRRLAASGMNDYGIAAATRLSVEMIRRVIGESQQRKSA
jgi:hypothetical protein